MKEKKYKAAIFDLDGVIVDTAEYHFQAWKRLADELEIPFDREINHLLRGVDRLCSLQIILDNAGKTVDNPEELADRKNEYYRQSILKLTPNDLLPGVEKLITTLRDNLVLIGVASSSKNAILVLKLLGIDPLLNAVVDGYGFNKAKPAPDAFVNCAQKLEVEPQNCVAIEDAQAGIDAAKSAGMFTVGVCEGQRLKDADFLIEETRNLPMRLFQCQVTEINNYE